MNFIEDLIKEKVELMCECVWDGEWDGVGVRGKIIKFTSLTHKQFAFIGNCGIKVVKFIVILTESCLSV